MLVFAVDGANIHGSVCTKKHTRHIHLGWLVIVNKEGALHCELLLHVLVIILQILYILFKHISNFDYTLGF